MLETTTTSSIFLHWCRAQTFKRCHQYRNSVTYITITILRLEIFVTKKRGHRTIQFLVEMNNKLIESLRNQFRIHFGFFNRTKKFSSNPGLFKLALFTFNFETEYDAFSILMRMQKSLDKNPPFPMI